jgi:hypothetical protein
MTVKNMEVLRNKRLTQKVLIAGLLGMAIGAAIGYVWYYREDVQRLPAGRGETRGALPRERIKPNEVLKLGLSLVTVTRQISDLAKKV